MTSNLLPFQTDAVAELAKAVKAIKSKSARDKSYNARVRLVMPCGMGKTVTLSHFIKDHLDQSVTLVVTPGKGDLAAQSHAVIVRELQGTGRTISLLGRNDRPSSSPKPGTVYVVNYEKVIVKDKKTGAYKTSLSADGESINIWDSIRSLNRRGVSLVLVVDEAHYGNHGSQGRISEFFSDISGAYGSRPVLIEATATPTSTGNAHEEVIEIRKHESDGVEKGLLRERFVLNFGRRKHEKSIADRIGKVSSSPVTPDEVMYELMYNRWDAVSKAILNEPRSLQYNPLMLFCISSGSKGADELESITTFLASKGITVSNGEMAVHTNDDKLSFEAKQALRNDDSPVKALVFKQSIAMGWDCPRAQFMMLTRDVSNSPKVFTDQLLGRIRRQPGARARSSSAINTAYVYSAVASAVDITQHSGVSVTGDSEDVYYADAGQMEAWNSVKIRRSTQVRKFRGGSTKDANASRVSAAISPSDIQRMLQNVPVGELSSPSTSYASLGAYDQTVRVGDSIALSLGTYGYEKQALSHLQIAGVAYVAARMEAARSGSKTVAAPNLSLQGRFAEAGVTVKGKCAETALVPFMDWAAKNLKGADTTGVKEGDYYRLAVSLLDDIEAHRTTCPTDSVVIRAMDALAVQVRKREARLDKHDYDESGYSEWSPQLTRMLRSTDAGRPHPGLVKTSLYGSAPSGVLTASESSFEAFLSDLDARNSFLISWLRNEPRIDGFGSAYSVGFSKSYGTRVSAQMFPDYLFLAKGVGEKIIPVAVEVKGTGPNHLPADASSDGSLDLKARRLHDLTTENGDDLKSASGDVLKTGKGDVIGAVVFFDQTWKVYQGGGISTGFVDWLHHNGVQV